MALGRLLCFRTFSCCPWPFHQQYNPANICRWLKWFLISMKSPILGRNRAISPVWPLCQNFSGLWSVQAGIAGVDEMVRACKHVLLALAQRFIPSDECPWGSRMGAILPLVGKQTGLAAPSTSLCRCPLVHARKVWGFLPDFVRMVFRLRNLLSSYFAFLSRQSRLLSSHVGFTDWSVKLVPMT